MGIRDEEIKRLVNYAKGLNVQVSFKDYVPYSLDAGFAAIDGSSITIATSKDDSKLSVILTLIHEVAHALEAIHTHKRRPDDKLDTALGDENENRLSRKIIYDFEKASTKWWEIIYRETDMKFPYKKLLIAKEYDLWQYSVWLRTGKFPNKKTKTKKRKQLKEKYASI